MMFLLLSSDFLKKQNKIKNSYYYYVNLNLLLIFTT
jgi:hypothetical protein